MGETEEEKNFSMELEMAGIKEVTHEEYKLKAPEYVTRIVMQEVLYRLQGVTKSMIKKVKNAEEDLAKQETDAFWNPIGFILDYTPVALSGMIQGLFPLITRHRTMYRDGNEIYRDKPGDLKFYKTTRDERDQIGKMSEQKTSEEEEPVNFYFWVPRGKDPLELLKTLRAPQTPQMPQGQVLPTPPKPPGDDPAFM